MKKQFILLIGLIVATLLFWSCSSKPCSYWIDEDDIEHLEVDGVAYSTKEDIVWSTLSLSTNRVGYKVEDGKANRKELVFAFEGDTEKMMMMSRAKGHNTVETYYYRDDYEWPDIDREGINMIGFIEGDQYQQDGKFAYYTDDAEIVDEVIRLYNSESTQKVDGLRNMIDIGILNNELLERNMKYIARIGAKNHKWWISFQAPNWDGLRTVAIAQEYVDALAGRSMPTAADYEAYYNADRASRT